MRRVRVPAVADHVGCSTKTQEAASTFRGSAQISGFCRTFCERLSNGGSPYGASRFAKYFLLTRKHAMYACFQWCHMTVFAGPRPQRGRRTVLARNLEFLASRVCNVPNWTSFFAAVCAQARLVRADRRLCVRCPHRDMLLEGGRCAGTACAGGTHTDRAHLGTWQIALFHPPIRRPPGRKDAMFWDDQPETYRRPRRLPGTSVTLAGSAMNA